MRNLLIIAAVLLSYSVAVAGAGENGNANTTFTPSVSGLFPHFTNSNNNTAGQGGGQTWQEFRLIAKANYTFNNGVFIPVDSYTYKYSQYRGGVPDPEQPEKDDHILFDESIAYAYDQTTTSFDNAKRRLQNFTDSKVTELVYQNWHTSATWKNSERYKYNYDNAGKMESTSLQYWYGQLWTNGVNSTLVYDNNNNVVEMNSANIEVDFIYDASNNLVYVEDMIWQQGTGWSKNQRKEYTYTGSEVTTYTLDIWLNGSWQHNKRWEYQYDADNNVIVSIEYSWNFGWNKYIMEEYTYDSNGNVLEKVKNRWDNSINQYIKSKKEVRTYNYKHQLETYMTYSWSGSKWEHNNNDVAKYYYYELYDPTDIPVLTGTDKVNIFPVPAVDNIIIVLPPEMLSVDINMTDMAGRTVYNAQQQVTAGNKTTIPVQHLQSGSYVITLVADGRKIHTDKVIVSH